jgi:glycosyltransferase involved in cell wall biosynthesis
VEFLVALMAEDMAARGHEVTVFGPADSTVATRVISAFDHGYHDDPSIWDWQLAEFMQLGLAYEHADQFDVIHSHVYCYALPFSRLVRTPTVHTFHICPTPDFVRACKRYPEGSYVLLSEFQRRFFDDVPVSKIVPNGIQTAAFPAPAGAGKYLAFLGDIRPSKGVLEAIDCARRAGVPLRIAGPENDYYREIIKPQVDGNFIEYVGEVDHHGKCDLLHDAAGLVFPVQALEACPTVILEALACGTPILALASGPVPELVEDGVTGFCVDDLDELPLRVHALTGLDRRRVRELAVARFDYTRMVADYLELYEAVITRSADAPTSLPSNSASPPARW